jgi:hypothetical protein
MILLFFGHLDHRPNLGHFKQTIQLQEKLHDTKQRTSGKADARHGSFHNQSSDGHIQHIQCYKNVCESEPQLLADELVICGLVKQQDVVHLLLPLAPLLQPRPIQIP